MGDFRAEQDERERILFGGKTLLELYGGTPAAKPTPPPEPPKPKPAVEPSPQPKTGQPVLGKAPLGPLSDTFRGGGESLITEPEKAAKAKAVVEQRKSDAEVSGLLSKVPEQQLVEMSQGMPEPEAAPGELPPEEVREAAKRLYLMGGPLDPRIVSREAAKELSAEREEGIYKQRLAFTESDIASALGNEGEPWDVKRIPLTVQPGTQTLPGVDVQAHFREWTGHNMDRKARERGFESWIHLSGEDKEAGKALKEETEKEFFGRMSHILQSPAAVLVDTHPEQTSREIAEWGASLVEEGKWTRIPAAPFVSAGRKAQAVLLPKVRSAMYPTGEEFIQETNLDFGMRMVNAIPATNAASERAYRNSMSPHTFAAAWDEGDDDATYRQALYEGLDAWMGISPEASMTLVRNIRNDNMMYESKAALFRSWGESMDLDPVDVDSLAAAGFIFGLGQDIISPDIISAGLLGVRAGAVGARGTRLVRAIVPTATDEYDTAVKLLREFADTPGADPALLHRRLGNIRNGSSQMYELEVATRLDGVNAGVIINNAKKTIAGNIKKSQEALEAAKLRHAQQLSKEGIAAASKDILEAEATIAREALKAAELDMLAARSGLDAFKLSAKEAKSAAQVAKIARERVDGLGLALRMHQANNKKALKKLTDHAKRIEGEAKHTNQLLGERQMRERQITWLDANIKEIQSQHRTVTKVLRRRILDINKAMEATEKGSKLRRSLAGQKGAVTRQYNKSQAAYNASLKRAVTNRRSAQSALSGIKQAQKFSKGKLKMLKGEQKAMLSADNNALRNVLQVQAKLVRSLGHAAQKSREQSEVFATTFGSKYPSWVGDMHSVGYSEPGLRAALQSKLGPSDIRKSMFLEEIRPHFKPDDLTDAARFQDKLWKLDEERIAGHIEFRRNELTTARDTAKESLKAARDKAKESLKAARDKAKAYGRVEKTGASLALKETKAELAEANSKVMAEAASDLADRIEQGVKALGKQKAPDETVYEMLDAVTLARTEKGQMFIDGDKFRAILDETYTEKGINWALDHMPIEDARTLVKATTSIRPNLDARDVRRLAAMGTYLERGARATHPEAAAMDVIEAMKLARGSVNLMRIEARGVEGFAAWIRGRTQEIQDYVHKRAAGARIRYDPLIEKAGTEVDELKGVIRGAEFFSAQLNEELLLLEKVARGSALTPVLRTAEGGYATATATERGSRIVSSLVKYVDTTAPIEIGGRSTFLNTGSGGTLWERSVRQLSTDPKVESSLTEIRNLAKGAVDDLVKAVETGDEEAAKAARKALVGVNFDKHVDMPDAPSKVLMALARAWLPSNLNASQADIAIPLYAAARKYLTDPQTRSYEHFAERMQAFTYALVGGTESSAGRGHAISVRAVGHGAMLLDTNKNLVRALGGIIEPEQAADIVNLLAGRAGKVEDAAQTLAGLNRLGHAFTDVAYLPTGSQTAARHSLESIGKMTTRLGEQDVFASKEMVGKIDALMGNIVKELFPVHPTANSVGDDIKRGMQYWLRAWKTSIITGLYVPNPRHWTNNLVGDFSQMWFELGGVTATKLSAQNFATNIPYIGTKMADAMSEISMSVGGGDPSRTLGTVMNALFNPHINGVFHGAPGRIITKNREFLPYEEVRRWVIEDGIMDSMVNNELLRAFERPAAALGNRLTLGRKNIQESIEHHATLVQQRQRVGLYMDLLQKGASRKEARERTLNALYDWRNAYAEKELNAAVNWIVPFNRFFKLAGKQMLQAFIDPFTKPSRVFEKALVGDTKLGHLRNQMIMVKEALPDFVRAEWGEESRGDLDEFQQLARFMYPEWMAERVVLGTWQNEGEVIDFFRERRHQKLTHNAVALPDFTVMSSAQMFATGMMLPVWVLSDQRPEGVAERMVDYVGGFMSPFAESAFGGMMQAIGLKRGGMRSRQRMKPSSYWALEGMTSWAGFQDQTWKDEQGLYADPLLGTAMDAVPLLGTQIPSILDDAYFSNPEWKGEFSENYGPAFLHFARQWSNIGRQYQFNPHQTAKWRQHNINAILKEEMEDVEKE